LTPSASAAARPAALRASSNPHFKSRLARSMTSSHPSDATYVAQLLSRGVENLAEVRTIADARAPTHSLTKSHEMSRAPADE